MSYNKFLVGVAVFTLGPTVFAGSSIANHTPGFYIGAQIGSARTNEGSAPEDKVKDKFCNYIANPKAPEVNKGKYGGRLFLGYIPIPPQNAGIGECKI